MVFCLFVWVSIRAVDGVFAFFTILSSFLEFLSHRIQGKKKTETKKQARSLYLCPFLSVEVNVCIILSLILIIIT